MNELVERFHNNIEVYESTAYDEAATRGDFIDGFFEKLGWDVNNKSGASEDFREVIREDKVVIQGRPKSPDYSFKIGRERQFFVEAKKPSVNIYHDIHSAFQLRRYAYTAGLPISILTNFEEFSIYDTSIKPHEQDNASVARIFYCKYNEYEKQWDFLNNTISKQAVWQGKLKKYTTDNTKKKGTQSVDKELLKLIEEWRYNLAKNISQHNKQLDIYQLNEAVQTLIDRIIFLRMAEDRNTEVYGFLQTLTKNKEIYKTLVQYFDSSNKKYNSGLFATSHWLDELIIDDKIFKAIINDLYYPQPYEFSVLPIEILGQIYEQFLGKTIVLSPRHVADVIEKPEVRKAGGVYYTPKYIVDYIVENTVGKKVENKTPIDIETLTILDPACGSGSFLVGAFKYLLNYHTEYYTNSNNRAKALKDSKIYSAGKDDFRLTIREKKKILLNNIYGVDIDSQAVEVTKLSLLLTLMEGEIVESRGQLFLKSISEALLPNLDKNIKCGNSLIGTDFYNDKDLQLFGRNEQRKINCFDWEVEFPNIFKGKKEKFNKEYFEKHLIKGVEKAKEAIDIAKDAYEHTNTAYEYAKKFDLVSDVKAEYHVDGGFDVIIGNPPYGADMLDLNYIKYHFKNAPDSFLTFMKLSLRILNQKGCFSFIVPSSWLTGVRYKEFRNDIINVSQINKVILLPFDIFEGCYIDTCIFIMKKEQIDNYNLYVYEYNKKEKLNSLELAEKNLKYYNINKIKKDKNLTISLNPFVYILKNNFQNSRFISLGNITKSTIGVLASKYKIYNNILKSKDLYKYFIGNINRYLFKQEDINYIDLSTHNKEYSNYYFGPKIIWIRRIINRQDRIMCTIPDKNYVVKKDIYSFSVTDVFSEKYVLGILNSKLISFIYLNLSTISTRDDFRQTTLKELRELPIKTIDFSNKKEKAQHDRMVSLVEQMLDAQKEAHSGKNITEKDKQLAQQRIKILDKQIDTLVYELYGLTEEEIKIIEN